MGPKTFDTPPGSKDSPGVGKMSSFAHLNGKHISGTIKPVSSQALLSLQAIHLRVITDDAARRGLVC